jgi:two-component system, cell cycle sensor histidine kinase and response regulator CckA
MEGSDQPRRRDGEAATDLESVARLVGGIAHDFNNLLFAIRGHADLLIEDIQRSADPDVRALLPSVEAIRSAANHAASLSDQLTNLSRSRDA